MCDVLIDVNEVILLKFVMFRRYVFKGMIKYIYYYFIKILVLITQIFIWQIDHINSKI